MVEGQLLTHVREHCYAAEPVNRAAPQSDRFRFRSAEGEVRSSERGRRRRRAIVHREIRRRAERWFASSPQPCQAAGRGHRRGLDGRVDAPHKYRNCSFNLSQPLAATSEGGWETLTGEVKEGMARRARGDTSQAESPALPCSAQAGMQPSHAA